MPALTRRRSTDAREESWLVFFGDVYGAGHAGSIRDRPRANALVARLRHSMKPARPSRLHGRCSWPTALMQTFRRSGTIGTGLRGNTRCARRETAVAIPEFSHRNPESPASSMTPAPL